MTDNSERVTVTRLMPIHYEVLSRCNWQGSPIPWGICMFLDKHNLGVSDAKIERMGVALRELLALGLVKVSSHLQGAIYEISKAGAAELLAHGPVESEDEE